MTLLHITATPERALLVTDTAAYQPCGDGAPGYDVLYDPGGGPVTWSKLHVLSHMHCLLMTRGAPAAPGRYVLNALRGQPAFDQAVHRLSEAMPAAPGAFASDEWGSEFHLIGWSEAEQAVRVARFDSEDGYRGALRGATSGAEWYMFSPEPSAARLGGLPQNSGEAASLARDSVITARASDPRVPFGGRLVVVELTRSRIVLEDGGEIGLPPRRSHACDVVDFRAAKREGGVQ